MNHSMFLGFHLSKRFFVRAIFFSYKPSIVCHLMGEDNDSAIKIAISLFGILVSAVSAVKE